MTVSRVSHDKRPSNQLQHFPLNNDSNDEHLELCIQSIKLSPNTAHGKRFKLIKQELLTPSPCCWVILNCFKPEKNWIIISTRLVGLQFTVPFRIIRIFQYNVKMEISAKLKARQVQIHIFHTKQNGIPWCHEYWKWSSQIQSDRVLSAGCAK